MGLFAKEGKKEGLDITALDLMYVDEEGRQLFRGDAESEALPNAVGALAQKMPFKKGSFDLITSLYSPFSYVKNVADIKQGFQESLRVLKKGGEIRIYPVEMYGAEPVLIIYESENSFRLSDVFFEILAEKQARGEIKFSIGSPSDDDNPFHYVSMKKL